MSELRYARIKKGVPGRSLAFWAHPDLDQALRAECERESLTMSATICLLLRQRLNLP
jgi:hypothetical protein